MMRYHINPATGKPGACRAKKACPFGDLETDHYPTVAAAQAGYEAKMQATIVKPYNELYPQATSGPLLSSILPLNELQQDIEDGYISLREHEDDPALKILCYSKATQYDGHWTEATKVARGLVVRGEAEDFSDAVVIQRPWRKFFTLEQLSDNNWVLGDEEREGDSVEAELAQIDFSAPVEVTDKMDGSMGILYLAPDGLPALATKGSFGSEQANHYTSLLRKDEQKMKDAKHLLKNWGNRTHLFELVGPDNRIVLDYKEEGIVLLGAVDKDTGRYLSASTQKSNWSGGIAEVMEAKTINEAFALPNRENREGVVIRVLSSDPNKQMQLKVKQEDYKTLHRVLSSFSVADMRASVRNSPATFGDLMTAAKSKNLDDIPGLRETYTTTLDHPAIGDAMSKRKAVLETTLLPRLEKLARAKAHVDALPKSFFDSPTAPKDFALSIKDENTMEKGDLFSFFQARLQGKDLSSFSAKKILGGAARDLSDKNLGLKEE